MLEILGLIAIVYLVLKYGGQLIKTALQVFLGLAIFFIMLPVLIALSQWIYGVAVISGTVL